MDSSQLGLFAVAVLILNITPGPDMLYSIATGLQRGPLAALVSAVGVGCGALFHGALTALGVSALLATSDVAFDVLRIAGAAYLIWIGLRAFRSPVSERPLEVVTTPVNYTGLFFRGLTTNILNPKVILFFVALLPQFIDPTTVHVEAWLFAMACFVGLSGTVINGAVGMFVSKAGHSFLRKPKLKKWINRLTGSIFIGLGIRIFLFERQ